MSNFDYLKKDSDYDVFTEACIEAENLMDVSYSAVATYSRRALELAVKWMFVNDRELHTPLQYTLITLITDRNFTNIIPSDMPKKLSYIQKLGNKSVHSDKKISRKEAILSLRNLFNFTNWIDYAYSKNYTDIEFDENILGEVGSKSKIQSELEKLKEELEKKNKELEIAMKANNNENGFSNKRRENQKTRIYKIDEK